MKKARKVLAAMAVAGVLFGVGAGPAEAKRPPCPGGSYVQADGVIVCLK